MLLGCILSYIFMKVLNEFDSRFSCENLKKWSKTAELLCKRIQVYWLSSHHGWLVVEVNFMQSKVGIFWCWIFLWVKDGNGTWCCSNEIKIVWTRTSRFYVYIHWHLFLLNQTLALSGDFQHVCDKMQVQIMLSVQWCVMCIFIFLKFDNFIKGIVWVYIVFLKKLRPLFLYLTYYHDQIFITVNRTDESFFT